MKNLLLIFDNMEHLVAVSAILGEILEQAPGIRLLLTSREAVHLQWEWIMILSCMILIREKLYQTFLLWLKAYTVWLSRPTGVILLLQQRMAG
jgi:hypothetical protein